MCGIAGHVSSRVLQQSFANNLLVRWHALLRHRGGDGWGWYACKKYPVLLFHQRLAITGVSRGHQPLPDERRKTWVTFNGEIYNYTALRQELEAAGHRFCSDSDAEVIVHLYETMGIDLVRRLRGEFSFALYDAAAGRIFLVRDRFGVKPLYYAQTGGKLLFGSEIKAIFADPVFPRRFDEKALQNHLQSFYFQSETVFEGVSQVPAGHYLCFDIEKSHSTILTYWKLPLGAAPSKSSEKELIETFRHLFLGAVRARIPKEVKWGAYLSGGLDSSAIVRTLAEVQEEPFPVFTLGFENRQYDESAYARRLAEQLGLPQHIVRVGKGDLKNAFLDSVWHSEMPVLNTHGAAKQVLAKAARQHGKVVLTGEGADELLLGYGMFAHLKNQEDADSNRMYGSRKTKLSVLQGQLSGRLLNYREVTAVFGAYPYAMQRHFFLRRISGLLLAGQYRGASAAWDWRQVLSGHFGVEHFGRLNSTELTQLVHLGTDFPAYLLNYLGDRQEMAAGLEGRVPFLDHELAEFTCTLPADMKFRDGTGKYILRALMRGQLDDVLCDRPKQVFYAPAFESIDFFKEQDFFRQFTGRGAFEEAGVFNPWFFGFLTRSIRVLPPSNKFLPVLESVAIFVLSLHIVHDLFIRNFDTWQRYFAPLSSNIDIQKHNSGLFYPRP